MNKKVLSLVIAGIVVVGGIFAYTNMNKKDTTKEVSEDVKIQVTHTYGTTEVKKNPERVVVLDYGSLDIIDAIDAESSVVGVANNNIPEYLSEFSKEKYVSVGGLKEFDIEKINELKPDLIIIEGRQAESYEDLSAIAPTIFMGADNLDFMGSLKKNSEILGEIFGKEDVVKEKLSVIEKEMAEVSEKVKKENIDASVLMVTDSSMSVYGESSRFNMIYNEFGFVVNDKNVGDSKHGENISYEYLLDKNPGYMFIIDKNSITGSDNNTAAEIVENEIVKNTEAYKNDNIVYLNPESWYLGGCGFTSTESRINDIAEAIK